MSALATVGVASFGAWAATSCYNFFEGERLWHDIYDELTLARASIRALDRACAENAERSGAIVSMTTIPSRIHLIGNTLKSLMRQTRAPARIVLNVPEYSTREERHYPMPDFLRGLSSVNIVRTKDWGPATKLIPCLLRCSPHQAIVVVDDDRIYPRTLIEDLDTASAAHPDCALGFSGWRVPADLTDRPTSVWANLFMRPPAPIRAHRLKAPFEVDVLQGLGGYLTCPSFFDIARLTDYYAAPAASFFVDDVWISGHCRTRKLVIPASRSNYPRKRHARYLKSTSVALINRGNGAPESRNNTIVLRYLKSAWLCARTGGPDQS